jgi:5-methyltetrahydrofolate--homocysteine methyltransferase
MLALAAKYGAMFILLPLKDKIPKTAKERKQIIEEVFTQAKRLGFTKDDIVVDGLVLSFASHSQYAAETLEVVSWCRNSFKCSSIIGLSNISFGMPNRPEMNAIYLAQAQAEGLNMVIASPKAKELASSKAVKSYLAKEDKDGTKFLEKFSFQSTFSAKKEDFADLPADEKVYMAIIEGNKEDIKDLIEEALSSGVGADRLVHKTMIPAINNVGELFDKKTYFLPQLIASAEAMNIAFAKLEPILKKSKINKGKKTVILLATVKGDIHDIGKNIVALMLKNHGFSVVDLGKDVSSAKIIRKIKSHKSCLVGLSSLMTTTMVNMKEVISMAKKENLNCRFIVGGAVITKAYARSLGAEYAGDGVEAVSVVKRLSRG